MALTDLSPTAVWAMDGDGDDSTANGNDLTVNSATTNSTDEHLGTGCYEVDGENDYFTPPSGAILPNSTSSDFTFAIWFYYDGTSVGENKSLWRQGNSPATGRMSTGLSTQGKATIFHNGGYSATGTTNITTDAWHLFVYMRESGTAYAIVDNVIHLKGSDSGTYTTDNYTLLSPNADTFPGFVDEAVLIDDTAMSGVGASVGSSCTGELAELFNSGDGIAYPWSTSSTTLGKLNGIAIASIAKINGVAKASIAKVNGVDL